MKFAHISDVATEISRQWGLVGLRLTQVRERKISDQKAGEDISEVFGKINELNDEFHRMLAEARSRR